MLLQISNCSCIEERSYQQIRKKSNTKHKGKKKYNTIKTTKNTINFLYFFNFCSCIQLSRDEFKIQTRITQGLKIDVKMVWASRDKYLRI